MQSLTTEKHKTDKQKTSQSNFTEKRQNLDSSEVTSRATCFALL